MLSDRDIESVGTALGLAYRGGALVGPALDLQRVGSQEEARAVQEAAALAHDGKRSGHALAATTPLTRRLLGCDGPIVGPIFADRILQSGDALSLRPSIIGVGAQLAFVFGRNLDPEDIRQDDPARLAQAIASCHLALQVVGRRVPDSVPLNSCTAAADLGLAEAFVQGPSVPDWRARLHPQTDIRLRLDGHVCATGRPFGAMGHPLAPIAWLARHLAETGNVIEAGDVVATGSCTGLLQVRPGQVATGDFGELGSVSMILA